jgi:hypothetical protein
MQRVKEAVESEDVAINAESVWSESSVKVSTRPTSASRKIILSSSPADIVSRKEDAETKYWLGEIIESRVKRQRFENQRLQIMAAEEKVQVEIARMKCLEEEKRLDASKQELAAIKARVGSFVSSNKELPPISTSTSTSGFQGPPSTSYDDILISERVKAGAEKIPGIPFFRYPYKAPASSAERSAKCRAKKKAERAKHNADDEVGILATSSTNGRKGC